ncbi:MAG: hypothetical protein JW958_09040 [Candidatus Eisenbacteria bacterium]|nr:hypothetical protein [Candidatus Eisenbacteria bacterium]
MRIVLWGIAAIVFLLPLIAMQVTDEVEWGVGDFVVLGALLVSAGVTFELAVRRTGSKAYRAAAAVALAAAFLLVWLSLGVGIIGKDCDPSNGMYFGVLAVGIIGSMFARFRPRGMARALIAMALAQVVVAAIALVAGFGRETANYPYDILLLTAFFLVLWLISARLFRKAAEHK